MAWQFQRGAAVSRNVFENPLPAAALESRILPKPGWKIRSHQGS
jgi:hypothetical protein